MYLGIHATVQAVWDVNPLVLTFLEVGFVGILVQGFRVYAWRAVPGFPPIALLKLINS